MLSVEFHNWWKWSPIFYPVLESCFLRRKHFRICENRKGKPCGRKIMRREWACARRRKSGLVFSRSFGGCPCGRGQITIFESKSGLTNFHSLDYDETINENAFRHCYALRTIEPTLWVGWKWNKNSDKILGVLCSLLSKFILSSVQFLDGFW